MRTIRSPANGVIAERYVSPGERVEEKPIVRLATIDPLRVEVVVPAQLFGSIQAGAWLNVVPELPNAKPRLAKVVLVDSLIDGPSNTFRARLQLPNANYEVPAGLRCSVELGTEGRRAPPPSSRSASRCPQCGPRATCRRGSPVARSRRPRRQRATALRRRSAGAALALLGRPRSVAARRGARFAGEPSSAFWRASRRRSCRKRAPRRRRHTRSYSSMPRRRMPSASLPTSRRSPDERSTSYASERDEDGLARISAELAARQDISAVHIISHGSDAAVYLGRSVFDLQSLETRAGELAGWSGSLTADADVLIYGCEVAQTAAGRAMLERLAALTGADVAASTDPTGTAALGGDWNLEYSTRAIEAHLALSQAAQDEWFGLLAVANVGASQDTYIMFQPPSDLKNFGTSTTLIADRESTDLQRVLVQFHLNAIPANATINSATLNMQAAQIDGALNIGVYEIQESWSEGVKDGGTGAASWDQRVPGTPWTSAGSTFDPTAVASINANAAGQHSWDITSLVQAWVDGSKANNGVMIGSPDGGGNRTVTYDSRETVGGSAPVLVIDYTVNPVNDAPAGREQCGHHGRGRHVRVQRGGFRLQRRRRQRVRSGEDYEPAGGGNADQQRYRGRPPANSFQRRTSKPGCCASRRPPARAARPTRASPSRCKTTAARQWRFGPRSGRAHDDGERERREQRAGARRRNDLDRSSRTAWRTAARWSRISSPVM